MDGSTRGPRNLGREKSSSRPSDDGSEVKKFPGIRKLKERQVIEILQRRVRHRNKRLKAEHPDSLQSIASEYGVTPTTIGALSRGESYREIYRKFSRD